MVMAREERLGTKLHIRTVLFIPRRRLLPSVCSADCLIYSFILRQGVLCFPDTGENIQGLVESKKKDIPFPEPCFLYGANSFRSAAMNYLKE